MRGVFVLVLGLLGWPALAVAHEAKHEQHEDAEPARMAQRLVKEGFTPNYDYALQMLTELPYDRWREFDPEDTLRFYALRLHEIGMINSTPNVLLADGTDWRFLNELKRELKA